MRGMSRRSRLAGAAVSTAAALAVFAALGGVGLASVAVGVAQYQYGKVTICHKGKNTISISVNAWPAHAAHGDTEGPCAAQAKAKKAKKKDGAPVAAPSSAQKGKKGKKGKKGGATSTAPTSDTTTTSSGRGNGRGQGKGKK